MVPFPFVGESSANHRLKYQALELQPTSTFPAVAVGVGDMFFFSFFVRQGDKLIHALPPGLAHDYTFSF